MNIVMVSPHFGPVPGGIQKDMLYLARELIALGDRVTFVTTYDEFPEGRVNLAQLLTYELPVGLRIVRLEGKWRSRVRNFHPANPPLYLPGLSDAIMAADPDGVIFFNVGWPLTVLPALIKLKRRTTVLYRTAYHAHLAPHRLDPWRARLQLRVAGYSDRLLTYSEHEREQIIHDGGIAPQKISVVYPGIEALPVSPEMLADFRRRFDLGGRGVISHVARLSAFKGTDRLIRALPEVRRRTGRDVVLLLVGRNLEAERLAQLAEECGVASAIRYTGPVSEAELHCAYAASDVFALPSHYESFGFVFLEAMAHGVPVIGVRTGGVPEVIRHGETGLILEDTNDAALTDALTLLIADEATRARMAAAGRTWTGSQFSWAASANTMRALINGKMPTTSPRLEPVT